MDFAIICKQNDEKRYNAAFSFAMKITYMTNVLDQIYVVLVETSHTGNIGSAARAMKTMGLQHLRLVAPKQAIDEQAEALSAGAKDVLDSAEIFADFDSAIADCQLVIGTSARLRHLQSSLIEPRACGKLAVKRAQSGKVAIIFGRERVGLTNDELLKCHYHLNFPTNPAYGSLNLAMAVQLASYEIRMAYLESEMQAEQNLQKNAKNAPLSAYPSAESLEHFYRHTERLYTELGFIRNDSVMRKLRRLYQRADVENNELNLLRGMLTAVEQRLK